MTFPAKPPAPMEPRTQFDYLLNAFQLASQSKMPNLDGYPEKRKALFAYVRDLEARRIPLSSSPLRSLAGETPGELKELIEVLGAAAWDDTNIHTYHRERAPHFVRAAVILRALADQMEREQRQKDLK